MSGTSSEERCLGCGEQTAVGTFLFSGRHDINVAGAPRAYLCDECYAKARAAKGGELTDADRRVIAKNGLVIAVGFFGHGGGI
jgi:hypothetical protein